MGRPIKHKTGVRHIGASWPHNETKELMKALKHLGSVENKCFSEIILKACIEYVERHYPGNPQLILEESIEEERQTFQHDAEREFHEQSFNSNFKLACGRGTGRGMFLRNAWKSLMRLQRIGHLVGDQKLTDKYNEWLEMIKSEESKKR